MKRYSKRFCLTSSNTVALEDTLPRNAWSLGELPERVLSRRRRRAIRFRRHQQIDAVGQVRRAKNCV